MKEFEVTITELLKRKITVTAETKEEAEELAESEWNDGQHVLDYNDFVNAEFSADEGKEKLIDALLIKPMQTPERIKTADGLKDLQALVGGYIECFSPLGDSALIICNEEGKLHGLPMNRAMYDSAGELVDVVTGDFIIVETQDDSFVSLSEEMMQKYEKLYEKPEKFYFLAGKMVVQKIELEKDKVAKDAQMEI